MKWAVGNITKNLYYWPLEQLSGDNFRKATLSLTVKNSIIS